jgi:polyisoprenoid-binding protein YceI
MKKLNFIPVIALAAVLLSFTVLSTSEWSLDKAHAKLGFSVTHLMVSDVEGSFKITEATITSNNEDFTDAVVTLTADVATVSTDNEQRDGHLKSADFFDAAKYPTITFKSFYFRKTKDKKYSVKGNLTMHGVTRPVDLIAVANTGIHPFTKKSIAGFKITGKLKRSDFGIGSSTNTSIVSDEVVINANAEFSKNDVAK